tara:strand:+ start:457 stop:726 length:270 start_codon:yes stop_codon:yes gene_type:complete
MDHQLDDIVTRLHSDHRTYGEALMLTHAKRRNMLMILFDKGDYDIGELRELFTLLMGRKPNVDESQSVIRNAICRRIANPSTVFESLGE